MVVKKGQYLFEFGSFTASLCHCVLLSDTDHDTSGEQHLVTKYCHSSAQRQPASSPFVATRLSLSIELERMSCAV